MSQTNKPALKRPPRKLPSMTLDLGNDDWEGTILHCNLQQSHVWEFSCLDMEYPLNHPYIAEMQKKAEEYGAVLVYFFPVDFIEDESFYGSIVKTMEGQGFLRKDMGYNPSSGHYIAMMYWVAPTYVGTGSLKYRWREDYWSKEKRKYYYDYSCCRFDSSNEDLKLEFFDKEPAQDNTGRTISKLQDNLWMKHPYCTKAEYLIKMGEDDEDN